MEKLIFEAHRGVATEFPENTLPAFQAAADQGYGMIELDPDVTADGHFVIHHDSTVNGRCDRLDGKIPETPVQIAELTLAEARRYDCGLWFNADYRGTPMPTIEETLDFACRCRIRLKFDNKLERLGQKGFVRFVETVRELDTAGIAGFTVNRPDDIAAAAKAYPGAWLHFDGSTDEETLKTAARDAGENPLFVWIPAENPHTSWCRLPKADDALCARVRKYAKLGLWLLTETAELTAARERYGASVIETNGALKPDGK